MSQLPPTTPDATQPPDLPRPGLGLGSLGRTVGALLATQVAGIILSIATAILYARALGSESYGVLGIALLLPTLLASLLNLGVDFANVYFVGRGDLSVQAALRPTLKLWALLSAAGGVLAALIILGPSDAVFPGVSSGVLWTAFCLFPLMLLSAFLAGLLRAVQDFGSYNRSALATPIAVGAVSAIALLAFGLGVQGAILGSIAGQCIGLGILGSALKPHLRRSAIDAPPADYVRQCVALGWKSWGSNLLTLINYRADLYLVNFLLGLEMAGVYFVATRLAERLWMFSEAVSLVVLPRLVELTHNEEQRRELTPIVARWVLGVTLLGAVVFVALGRPLILLMFGPQYVAAYGALVLMLPGIVALSLSRVLSSDISARGRPDLNMWTATIVVLVTIVANIVLIPILGLLGGALATTLAYGGSTAVKLIIYSRLSGNKLWAPLLPSRSDLALARQAVQAIRVELASAKARGGVF